MEKIVIISTGGTFNKIYNPIDGSLIIDKSSNAIKEIAEKWLCEFDVISIIGKDSLDIDNKEREELLKLIINYECNNIIIVHGTDTMDITAELIANHKEINKKIILTGAMTPYSIEPIEATANLSSSYGFLNNVKDNGVYISMNGVIGDYKEIVKDRINSKFRFGNPNLFRE